MNLVIYLILEKLIGNIRNKVILDIEGLLSSLYTY